METRPFALSLFFCVLLSFDTVRTSGAFLDFSYDATEEINKLSNSQYKTLITEQQHVYLFLKPFECSRKLCTPKDLATSWLKQVLVPNLHLNISNIIVTGNERQLPSLYSTLESLHPSLQALRLEQRIKLSPAFSLSFLETMAKNKNRHWRKVVEFVKGSDSFVLVETRTDDELAVISLFQKTISALTVLSHTETAVVLHLKSCVAPSAVEMAKFNAIMEEFLHGHAILKKRFLGLLVDISSPRRELITRHDMFAPVTNPTTTPPITVPSTDPASPGIVTVPSTNPGSVYPNNPTMAPTTIPPLNPEPTPVTTPVPAMNPVMPTPVTAPVVPVTNPATTPTTFPGTSPVTNPVTPYPYPQQGGTPVIAPPTTVPVTPTVSGQAWCIAKTGLMDIVLQNGLDYACGIGGVDCSPIQPLGSCYNPNTLQAHASYAFNSYFQRNPTPASCDFGGAGMVVNMNPSSGTCMYQTSGFGAGYSPAAAGTGSAPGGGSGSTVLNANNPGGSTGYGSFNPTGMTSNSFSLSCGWVLSLIWIFTFAYIRDKV